MASQLLALSLFIMLLAFFIVLNAISSFEESRFQPVLSSLGDTFSSRVNQSDNARPSVTVSPDESIDEGTALERMQLLFNAQIPGQKSAVNNTRGTLHVRVPYEELNEAVMSVGAGGLASGRVSGTGTGQGQRAGHRMFLPALTALMKGEQVGLFYRVDMVLNIGGNPARMQNHEPLALAAIMKDMGRIGDRLEQAGLPPRLISTGVQQGRSGEVGYVDLLFRAHEPFNPLGEERGF